MSREELKVAYKGITDAFQRFIIEEAENYDGSMRQFCTEFGITRKALYKLLAGDDKSGYNSHTIDNTLKLRELTIIDLMERYGKR